MLDDKEAFAAWLASQPKDRQFGGGECNCPISDYLTEKAGGARVYVSLLGYATVGGEFTDLPEWAEDFVDAETSVAADAPDAHITAEEALTILREVAP